MMSLKKKNKKAQVWAIDLSVALVIFIGVIFLFYRYSISFAPEDPLINKMIKEGGYVSNTLLSSGYPQNWETLDNLENIYSIGLIGEDDLLDINKINNFTKWSESDYATLKRKINTKYDYYIEFKDTPETNALDPIGQQPSNQPPDNAKQIIKIQRLVAYHDSDQIKTAKLILYLWTTNEA